MAIGGNVYNTYNPNLKIESDERWIVDPKEWIMWTQLRFLDYIKYFLYLSIIITIIFQQELRALKYATSMIISTRRILLATDDLINKGGKLIYPSQILY